MNPDDLRKRLGLWLSDGLGSAYPDLRRTLARLVTDRIAAWPWLPNGWAADYAALSAGNPAALVRIAPAKVIIPVFCDTPQKVDLWNRLAADMDAAVGKYAQAQAAAGKAELDALYARVAFWNEGFGATLIATAETIRDLPANTLGAVADGVGAVAGGILGRLARSWVVWVALLGVGAFYAHRFGWLKLPKKART